MKYLELPKISKEDVGNYLGIKGKKLDNLWDILETNYKNVDYSIWYYIEETYESKKEQIEEIL